MKIRNGVTTPLVSLVAVGCAFFAVEFHATPLRMEQGVQNPALAPPRTPVEPEMAAIPNVLDCMAEPAQRPKGNMAISSTIRAGLRQPAVSALSVVLTRASRYVSGYEAQLGDVVGEEVYVQNAAWKTMRKKQSTQSEFAILQVGNSWIAIREVRCRDSVAVEQQVQDFQSLINRSTSRAERLRTLAKLSEESARYNIGDIKRDTNLPTFALRILHAANLRRFKFKKSKVTSVRGIRAWAIDFEETQSPTMIHDTLDQDEFATGTLWVEPNTGAILETELKVAEKKGPYPFTAQTNVFYDQNQKLDMLVPSRMTERYTTAYGHSLDCEATYFNFRRFQTTVRFDFGPPPAPLRPPK